MTLPSLDEYIASLTNLAAATDPTVLTAEGAVIGAAANALAGLKAITRGSLAKLIREHPEYVPECVRRQSSPGMIRATICPL